MVEVTVLSQRENVNRVALLKMESRHLPCIRQLEHEARRRGESLYHQGCNKLSQ